MPQAVVVPIAISFAMAGASYAYQKFTQKPIGVGDRNFQINITDTKKYLPVIYGRAKVGISIVFHDSEPNDRKSYWLVGAICLGEIEAIDRIWFDDRLVVDYESDGVIAYPYNGYCSFARQTGTENQTASADLISKFPNQWNANCKGNGIAYIIANIHYNLDRFPNGVPKISVSIRGKKVKDVRDVSYPNVAAAYSNNPALCNLDYLAGGRDTNNIIRYGLGVKTNRISTDYWIDEANFCDDLVEAPLGSPPAPKPILVNAAGNLSVGKYRYRLTYKTAAGEHTAAGSISKSINTTNNKKQIKLTQISPSGSVDVDYIDIYRTAANGSVYKYVATIANVLTDAYLEYSDNIADASLGATAPDDDTINTINPIQARFLCDGLVDCSKSVKSNIEDLLTSCRGQLFYQAGLYALFIKKAVVAETFELTPDNIIGNWEFNTPGVGPMANIVKVSFPNRRNKWETDYVFWPLDIQTNRYLAEDAGVENIKTVDLFYTIDRNRARQIGQVIRKESRQGINTSCLTKEEALKLRIGSVVKTTHPTPAWTQKQFWVDGLSLHYDGTVRPSLSEYDSTVYDYETINNDTVGAADTDLPDPFIAPDEVTSVVITEELYYDNTIPAWRLKVTYTDPTSPLWDHSDVYLKAGDSANYEYYTRIDRGSAGKFYIYPVEALTTYYIKILSVSTIGVKNDIDDPDNTIWDYEIVPPIPPTPTNLQIINRGNNSNVYGKDFIFTWMRGSSQGDGNANNSYAQRQTGFVNEDIRYIVEIYYSGIPDNVRVGRTWLRANQMIAHSEIVQHNRYIFSLEDNIEASKTMWEEHASDANYADYYGIPQRTIKVRVWAINAWSVKSATYAEIEVTNLAPDMEDENGDTILPEAYREKSALEFTWPHPYKEYDISRFIGVLATDGQLVNRIESKTIASAVTVWDTDEDVNGVEYTVKFRNLDPKVVYYFAVFPVDVYGKGTRSQIVSNNPAITHDDDNSRITPPGQVGSVTAEVLKNNAGKIKWALLNVDDIKRYIVDWRGVENLAASSAPSDDEVAQGYLDSDSNKKVLGGHLDIPGDKAYAIVKGLKAGFKYFARVRAENSSEQLGAWSSYATHSATVVGDPADVGDGTITPPKLNLNDIITFLHNGGGGFDFKDSSAVRRLTLRAISSGAPLLGIAKAGYDAYTDRDDLNKMFLTSKAKGYLSYIDSGQTSITFDEAASTPTDTEVAQDESISLNIAENIVRGVLAFANFSLGGRDYMVPLNGFQDFTTAGKTLQFFFAYDSTDATHLLKVRRWIKNNSGGDWTVPALTIKVNWYVLGETLLKS